MTKEEFATEIKEIFTDNSSPVYSGSPIRKLSVSQQEDFFTKLWEIKSVHEKTAYKEKLVKELVRRTFDCEQDRVDFILAFLA